MFQPGAKASELRVPAEVFTKQLDGSPTKQITKQDVAPSVRSHDPDSALSHFDAPGIFKQMEKNPVFQKAAQDLADDQVGEVVQGAYKAVIAKHKEQLQAYDPKALTKAIPDPRNPGSELHMAIFSKGVDSVSGTSLQKSTVKPDTIKRPAESMEFVPGTAKVADSFEGFRNAQNHGDFLSKNPDNIGVDATTHYTHVSAASRDALKSALPGLSDSSIYAHEYKDFSVSPPVVTKTLYSVKLENPVALKSSAHGPSQMTTAQLKDHLQKTTESRVDEDEIRGANIHVNDKFTNRKLDSESMQNFNYRSNGIATAMAEGRIEDHAVRTVALHDETGNVKEFRSHFRLTDAQAAGEIEKFFKKNGRLVTDELVDLNSIDSLGRLTSSGKQETWTEMLTAGTNKKGLKVYTYKTAGGTEISFVASNRSVLNGLVLVKSTKGEQVQSNLQEAMKMMGLKTDYAEPHHLEEMKWRKAASAALTGPEREAMMSASPAEIRAALKKRYPDVDQVMDDQVLHVDDGHFTPTFSKEFYDKVIAPAASDVFHDTVSGGGKGVVASGGLLSTVGRFVNGFKHKGLGSDKDIIAGGAHQVFTRVSKLRAKLQPGERFDAMTQHLGQSEYQFGKKIHMMIRLNPEILRRTDHYSYSGLQYGVSDPTHPSYNVYKERKTVAEVAAETRRDEKNDFLRQDNRNETMFKHGVGLSQFGEMVLGYNGGGDHLTEGLDAYYGLPKNLRGKVAVKMVEIDRKTHTIKRVVELNEYTTREFWETLSPDVQARYPQLSRPVDYEHEPA
jgi:hypothetical protein